MAFLTIGVLTFQAVIFVTIAVAASMGRTWLNWVAALWTAFTLFGSIFTWGLLLIQLATIYLAYRIGKRIAHKSSGPLEDPR
jgi:hypothetical protein